MSNNRFIYGSFVMIIVNIFVRVIGFSYEVILSKALGAEGMGLFGIAMTTLMVFLSVTTSGIPTSLTKLVAEEASKNNHDNVRKIYNSTMVFNLCLSILLGGIILLFSEFIAIKVFKNIDIIYGIYLLIPALIILSLTHVLKSYFYGIKNMITPSIAQIIESLTRFIIIVTILYYFPPKTPIEGAILAILGISIGEFSDLIWSLGAKRKISNSDIKSFSTYPFSIGLLGKVLFISLPLTMSGFFNIALGFINTIMIPSRLIASGYTNQEAIATFGRVTGMAMPLIHLPFMVTSAIVVSLISSLSEHMVFKRYSSIKNNIQLAIKATLMISIPLTGLFVILFKPLAIFLYNDPQVGEYIRILGYGTILLSLQHTLSGILFGLGKHMEATVNRLLCMSLRVVLLYVLVGNPKFHIYGFFISFFVTNLLIFILDVLSLKDTINLKLNYFDIVIKPLIASIFMIGYIQMSTYDIENLHNVNPLTFIFTLTIAFLSYILILTITNAMPKDVLDRITKGG